MSVCVYYAFMLIFFVYRNNGFLASLFPGDCVTCLQHQLWQWTLSISSRRQYQ